VIDTILNNQDLFAITREECSENGVCVRICENLLSGGHLNSEKIVILKPDDYFNSLRYRKPPPSIDCLIIIKRSSNEYDMFMIELRDTKTNKLACPLKLRPKFESTVNIFLKDNFSNIFENPKFKIRKIKAYFVTDPFNGDGLTDEQYRKKVAGTVLDNIALCKPIKFRDKIIMLEHKRPSPEIC